MQKLRITLILAGLMLALTPAFAALSPNAVGLSQATVQIAEPQNGKKPDAPVILSIATVLGKPSTLAFTMTNGSQRVLYTQGFRVLDNWLVITTPSGRQVYSIISVHGRRPPEAPIQPSEHVTWEIDMAHLFIVDSLVESGQYKVRWEWGDVKGKNRVVYQSPDILLLNG